VRVIVQYDALRASPARTTLESSKNLNGDVFLRYFVNHGTAFFVGYNGTVRDEDPLAPAKPEDDGVVCLRLLAAGPAGVSLQGEPAP